MGDFYGGHFERAQDLSPISGIFLAKRIPTSRAPKGAPHLKHYDEESTTGIGLEWEGRLQVGAPPKPGEPWALVVRTHASHR